MGKHSTVKREGARHLAAKPIPHRHAQDILETAVIELPNHEQHPETTVAPLTPAPRKYFFRHFSSTAHNTTAFMRSAMASSKRTFAGMSAGLALSLALTGALVVNRVSQAQAVADHSVLASSVLSHETPSTPKSLEGSRKTQARAQLNEKAETAKMLAESAQVVCSGYARGASSLMSSYIPENFQPIYMPIKNSDYELTSPFGKRESPLTGVEEFHTGVDMAGAPGTPIHAIASGRVLTVTYDESVGNNGIVIEHHVNGKVFTSWYLHSYANDIVVKPGDEVEAGQAITAVGSAGLSTGPHLHFEFHWGAGLNTDAVDPQKALSGLGAMEPGEKCEL